MMCRICYKFCFRESDRQIFTDVSEYLYLQGKAVQDDLYNLYPFSKYQDRKVNEIYKNEARIRLVGEKYTQKPTRKT